jgi:hypothetical protein
MLDVIRGCNQPLAEPPCVLNADAQIKIAVG